MSVLTKQTTNNQLQTLDNNNNLVPYTPAPMVPQVQVPKEISINDIFSILNRRKWVILLTLLTTVLLSLIYTFSAKPSYRANAMIQIEREGAEIVTFGQTQKPSDAVSFESDPFFRTRYEMLKGRVIAQRVINELNLKESLAPKQKDSIVTSLMKAVGLIPKDDGQQGATDYNALFTKNLFVQPISGTHLVEIFYEASNPIEARNVVNSLIDNFIKLQIESKSETGEYAKEFLAKQIEEAGERLRNAEEDLVQYANKKGILGVDEKQTRQVKKLENLDAALVQAEIRRIEAESLYLQMKRAGSVSTVLTNPVITSLKARLVQLEGDYQEMLKTFKPNYPDMRRLQQQINSARGKLNGEMVNIQRSMEADYKAAKRQEDKIRNELKQFNTTMKDLQDSSLDYNNLKREVESSSTVYNNLLQRLEEVNVASAANTSSISITEPAIIPLEKYRPKPKMNLMLGILSGLILGLAFAFLREALDQTVKSKEDLERITGLPVLGMIPKVSKFSMKKHLDMIAHKIPQSPASEAYRILATNLRLMVNNDDEHIMLFTSIGSGEGKSTSASNIACALSQMGKKVLLVDADIRNASIHNKLDITNKKGLTHYLKGESDLVGITQPVKSIPGLYAITAGQYETDPVSLLSHERMSYLTTQGASIFDHVIIDAPPVSGFADTLVLSSLATSTVVVLPEDKMDAKSIKNVLSQLTRVKNNVAGFLLMNTKDKHINSKYYAKYHKKGARRALLESKSANYA